MDSDGDESEYCRDRDRGTEEVPSTVHVIGGRRPRASETRADRRGPKRTPAPMFSWWELLLIWGVLIAASILVVFLFVVLDIDDTRNDPLDLLSRSSSGSDGKGSSTGAPGEDNGTGNRPFTLSPDNAVTDPPFEVRGSESITELLAAMGIDPPPEGSPQSMALNWLVHDDTESREDYMNDPGRLRQRYALLVFYYATGTWNGRGGWATMSGAQQHECQWPGIYCNADDRVESLEIDLLVGLLQGSIPSEVALLSDLGKALACHQPLTYSALFPDGDSRNDAPAPFGWRCPRRFSYEVISPLFLTESLVLVNNLLTGDMPAELFSLPHLYAIDLSNTMLSSTLNPLIGALPSLVYFNVMYTDVSGTIPTELGRASNLRRLYLAHTDINGALPTELGWLTSLESLFVHNTGVTGTVPNEVCGLRRNASLESFRADCVQPSTMNCECCTRCY